MRHLRERYTGEEAERYETRRRGPQWEAEERYVARALDHLTPATVLDAPCGTGRFWPLYEERGIKATGLDVSPDMLRQAKSKGWDRVSIGDVFRTGHPDRSFDLAVCVRFLNWTTRSECVAALGELGRIAPRVVVSLGVGEGRHGRTQLHDEAVVGEAGLRTSRRSRIQGWGYWMMTLEAL